MTTILETKRESCNLSQRNSKKELNIPHPKKKKNQFNLSFEEKFCPVSPDISV